jgi:hypothetical protein
MPINCLAWKCLIIEETSLRQSGRTARLQRKAGECVLVFRTDIKEFRTVFGLKDEEVSDGLFLFRASKGQQPYCIFVELNGKGTAGADDQLMNTIKAVRRQFDDLTAKTKCKTIAVVVFGGGAPRDLERQQDAFLAEGVRLLYFSRESLDLRTEVLRLPA